MGRDQPAKEVNGIHLWCDKMLTLLTLKALSRAQEMRDTLTPPPQFITSGALIIATSILAILNPFQILNLIRSIWNIVFGTLMIFLQLNWKKMRDVQLRHHPK